MAVDKAPEPGDGETALEPAVLFLLVDRGEHFFVGGDDLGVDKDFGFFVLFVEKNKEAFVQADLGGGQTDTLGVGGFFEDGFHFPDLFGGFFVPGSEWLGYVLQERMRSGQNLHLSILPFDL